MDNSEAFRLACELRSIRAMPLIKRRAYFEGVRKARGDMVCERLKEQFKSFYYAAKE